jgi:hypothetical protein
MSSDNAIPQNEVEDGPQLQSRLNGGSFEIESSLSLKEKRNGLISEILQKKQKLGDELQLISLKYDKTIQMFNLFSLAIMSLSACITFFDAVALTVSNFIMDIGEDNERGKEIFLFSVRILTLCMGTILTIISSVIRFKNYKEKMERLRDLQEQLIQLRGFFNQEIDIILCSDLEDKTTIETIKKTMSDYSNRLQNINVISELNNKEMKKFIKTIADFKLYSLEVGLNKQIQEEKMKKSAQIEIQKIRMNEENNKK